MLNFVSGHMWNQSNFVFLKLSMFFLARGAMPTKIPPPGVVGALAAHATCLGSTPGSLMLWIESSNQLVIGYNWLAFCFCWKILLREKVHKNRTFFCIRFRTLYIFWDTKKICPVSDGRSFESVWEKNRHFFQVFFFIGKRVLS